MHPKQGQVAYDLGWKRSYQPLSGMLNFPLKSKTNLSHMTTQKASSQIQTWRWLFQWMALENVAKLAHVHVACWCDNTPTVLWASQLLATKATNAAHLLCILALQMIACQASPMTMLHIAGEMNKMADFVLWSFVTCPDTKQFLTEFHTHFPLPQDASWIAFQFPKNVFGRIFSALLTPTLTMGSWLRLTKQGSITGGTGKNFFQSF